MTLKFRVDSLKVKRLEKENINQGVVAHPNYLVTLESAYFLLHTSLNFST